MRSWREPVLLGILVCAACAEPSPQQQQEQVDLQMLEPVKGSFTLNGIVSGYTLQQEMKSVAALRLDRAGVSYTSVSLIGLSEHCELLKKDQACPGRGSPRRVFNIWIRGAAAGTYTISKDPPFDEPAAGQARVVFYSLDESCMDAGGTLAADSGMVTFSEIDLGPGRPVVLSFSAQTSQGAISGSVTAPACAL